MKCGTAIDHTEDTSDQTYFLEQSVRNVKVLGKLKKERETARSVLRRFRDDLLVAYRK